MTQKMLPMMPLNAITTWIEKQEFCICLYDLNLLLKRILTIKIPSTTNPKEIVLASSSFSVRSDFVLFNMSWTASKVGLGMKLSEIEVTAH